MGKSEKRIGRRPGGQPGNQNALKHGLHTARAKAERRWMRDLVGQSVAHLRVLTATEAEAGFVSGFGASGLDARGQAVSPELASL
jgi:hypothetical protein